MGWKTDRRNMKGAKKERKRIHSICIEKPWQFACSGFEIDRKIGKGQFSVVYRAKAVHNGMVVALKKVQIFEMMDSKARLDCMKEIQLLQVQQTRRIYTEDKAKVVPAVWGDRIYSLPCCASCYAPGWYEEKDELNQDNMKKMMNSSYSSNRPSGK